MAVTKSREAASLKSKADALSGVMTPGNCDGDADSGADDDSDNLWMKGLIVKSTVIGRSFEKKINCVIL